MQQHVVGVVVVLKVVAVCGGVVGGVSAVPLYFYDPSCKVRF